MSQAGSISTSSSPSVPTSFTTDLLGPAVPVANILDVLGGTSTDDNNNGIQTTGTGKVLTIELTNILSGSGSAVGAVTADIITFDLGSSGAVYRFDFDVAGRDTSTGDGVGYKVFATARTDGASATVVDTAYTDNDEDTSLEDAEINVVASGNDIILQVTGVAGQTITYKSMGRYIVV